MKPATTELITNDMPLDTLAELANDAAEQVENNARKTVQMAIAAGEALTAAKSQVPHGEWLVWLGKNFNYSQQHASRYMSLSNYARVRNLKEASSIREALRIVANDQETPKRDRTPSAEVLEVAADEPVDIASEVAAECGVTREQIIQDGQFAEALDIVSTIDPDILAKVRSGNVTQDDVMAAAKGAAKPVKAVKPAVVTSGKAKPAKAVKAEPVEYLYSLGERGWEFVFYLYRQRVAVRSGDCVSLNQLCCGDTAEDESFVSRGSEKAFSSVSEIEWRECGQDSVEEYETNQNGERRTRELDLRRFEQREGGGKYLYFEPGRVCYYDETAINAILEVQAIAHRREQERA